MRGMQRKYWTVLKTKDATSKVARREVGQQGFEIYHPLYRTPPKLGVRKNLPLFPYYLLVRVNPKCDEWRNLCSTRGVSRVFMSGDHPSYISDLDVQRFRELEDDWGYFTLPEHAAPRFARLSSVQVKLGWMEGCHGVYQGLAGTSHERVKVLFSILGVPKILEMSAFDLTAA